MGKQHDQAMVMLATIAGCLETMRQSNSFARIDIKQTVVDCFDDCATAINLWPGMINRAWVKEKREGFKQFVMVTNDRGYSTCTLAAMCERLVTDLSELAEFGQKKRLIEPIVGKLKIIHDFCDPLGINFPAYEKSDFLLDELYRLICWQLA